MVGVTIPEEVQSWAWREPPSPACAAAQERTPRFTLVMFRDSYAEWLMPFLERQFRLLAFGGTYSPALVREHTPDVVIQEVAERYLPGLFDTLPGAPSSR
jgi:hypothetical protein